MGMEDGSNYFDSGGSGDGGGSYDLGGDFVYGYGQGGGDFVIDPGFGLPDNVSPEGDAIAWGFDTTSWPTLDQGFGGDFNYGYGVGTESDLGPVADQALMIDPYTGLIDVGGGYGYDPVADQFYDIGQDQGFGTSQEWQQIYDDWRAFGVDPDTAAQLADTDYQALRESQGVISISQSASELPKPPDLPDYAYYPLPYNYNPWESPPYIPNFDQGPIPPPPLPPSPASAQPNLPPACAAGTYHPYPIGHPQQNICVPFPAATTNAPKPPTGTATGQPSSKPPATKPPTQPQACPPGYTRDVKTGQCKPPAQPNGQPCPPGQYYSMRVRRCVPIPKCATGFIFDPVIEACVRLSANVSPLPVGGGTGGGFGDIGDSISELLKNTPWWLWGVVLAAIALSGNSGEQRKRVTVQHRRAT